MEVLASEDLQQALKVYTDPATVEEHVTTFISHRNDFVINTYSFRESGKEEPVSLISLNGVLPIQLGQRTQGVTLTIALTKRYPRSPPKVFVIPSRGWKHCPDCEFLDAKGRVVLSKLSPTPCTVIALVDTLAVVFAESFPLAPHSTITQKETRLQDYSIEEYRRDMMCKAREFWGSLNEKLASQLRVGQFLSRKSDALSVEMRYVKQDLDEVRQSSSVLEASEVTFNDWIANGNTVESWEGLVELNSLKITQVVLLVADNQAIEDTIYILGRALQARKLPVTQWVQELRKLQKDQYLIQATLLKCLDENVC